MTSSEERKLLSEYIVERMQELGLSDERLAMISSVNRTTIFRVRKGQSHPQHRTLNKILTALDGADGMRRFRTFLNRRSSPSKSEEIKEIRRNHQRIQRDEVARKRERQRLATKFSNVDVTFLARKTDTDKFAESRLRKVAKKCDENFDERTFEVSFHTDDKVGYALWVLPNHIERLNYLSARIVGSESYSALAPILADFLMYYGDVAIISEDRESAKEAAILAEELFRDAYGAHSKDKFNAIYLAATADKGGYEYKAASLHYERALRDIESWDDTVFLSLPYLIEEILDPISQFFSERQDYEKELETYRLKLRATNVQLSRKELEHLKPDILSSILLGMVKLQSEVWQQEEDTDDVYSALHTCDVLALSFGGRVKEKLLRLVALDEVEI